MGHLAATINPMQRSRWMLGIEMEMRLAGTTPERVTGRMLEKPDRF